MSIATPVSGILNFKIVPVDCSSCAYTGDLTGLSDDAKKVLIRATTANQLNEERKMLIQLRELFDRHPDTKHEIVLSYTSRLYRENIEPEPDSAFESDLAENPDIAEFLRDKVFGLDVREVFTADADKRLRSFQDRTEITCPECGACLVVPDVFYGMVGRYEDDIARERSRKQGRALKRKLQNKQSACK